MNRLAHNNSFLHMIVLSFLSCIIKCFHVSHMPSIHWVNHFFNKVQLFLLCYYLRFVNRQRGEHFHAAGWKINKPVITGDTLKTWLFNYLKLSKSMLFTLIFSDFHVWVKTNSQKIIEISDGDENLVCFCYSLDVE